MSTLPLTFTRATIAFLAVTVLAALLGLARHFDPLVAGLRGNYFATLDWSSVPLHSTIDRQPSTESLLAAWHAQPPSIFGATWTGSLLTLHEDTYTIATASDDGSWVYVDGRLVVENGGRHSTQTASGSVHLARGVHTIFITYFQDGGLLHFDLLWSRGTAPLESIPSWLLTPRHPTYVRFLASVGADRCLALLEWLWAVTLLLVVGAAAWPGMAAIGRTMAHDPSWRALGAVVAGSVILNVTGIWWGLPGTGWAGDELTPTDVFTALAQHFSHGWYDRWPPFHYYVLTVAFGPFLVLERLGRIDLAGEPWATILTVIARLVSVAAGAGTIVTVYVCGARAFSKRAGLFAAAAIALVAPFVYYSKTANLDLPWLFWFALSLAFYLRLLDTLCLRDFLLFAVLATLATCTKDQSYGLYLATPFVIVYEIWRQNRQARLSRPLARAVLDPRLLAAAATAALVFAACHNLLFNSSGFMEHVRYITGGGSAKYQMVEATPVGHVRLLQLTADVDRVALGWPLAVASLAGFIVALAAPEMRRVTLRLALIVVSYYLGFVSVILYNYDRFLLPVCLVQALLIGVACDRFVGARVPAPMWRRLVVGAALAYTILYAGTVDALMIRDSRYAVEDWLRTHVRPNEAVGTMFPRQYLPRLDVFQTADVGTIEDLHGVAPAFYVLNADYGRTMPPETPGGQLINGLQHGTLGYTLVLRCRSPGLWSSLPGGHRDLVGPRADTLVSSFLRNINPTIEIYERERPTAAATGLADHPGGIRAGAMGVDGDATNGIDCPTGRVPN